MTIQLETPRLILRPPVYADLDPLAAMMAEPETVHIGGPYTKPEAWRQLVGFAGGWSLMGFAMFSVIEKSTGKWIGRIGPHQPEGWPGTEVGWGLTRDAYGKGYAVEAATASMDWAFDTLGWTTIIHTIAAENAPSRAVAQRLGSYMMGHDMLPPPISKEVEIWGQTREEWRARSR